MESIIKRSNIGFVVCILLLSLPILFSDETFAQFYFGRNKVQYEQFDFKILKTDNFDLYFYPSEEGGAKDAARMLERWYARFSQFFDHEIQSRQPLILYANHADFQQTNVIRGLISPGTGGVTEGLKNRIVLPLTGIYADNHHVLGHELVHAFQYDMVKSGPGNLAAMSRLPLWFIEGMAEYLTIGPEHALTAMWMRDAVLHDDVPTIRDMTVNPDYFPYRFGHAFWAFVGGRWGDKAIPLIYKTVMRTNLDSTFRVVLGDSAKNISEKWVASVKETYESQLRDRTKPEEVGKPILTEGSGLNLAPSISPNGRHVAFLSSRDLFTIDLFLADARSGEVLDKLVSTSSDAHFDALRFTDSAGAWSPDGRLFAFAVFKDGDNGIAIVDVESRDIKESFKIDGVEGIINLAWAPNGESIAFSGISGGIGDLYLYHFESNKTVQLTDDRFAELQPAWSPDGRTIAFATDRGEGTDLEKFKFAPMKIALLDLEQRKIELLSMSDEVKHINPQYSPDGRQLYFISDPGGFSDIFAYSFDSGQFRRLTQIATGVTGITATSPAMSVAGKDGRIVFSVFNKREYHVHALDPGEKPGELLTVEEEIVTEAALPPFRAHETSTIREYLVSADQGLPAERDYPVTDYDASLGFIAAGATTIGASVDRFGTAFGGAVSLVFGDMLGNHLLGVDAQINGGIKDFGAQVVYQNRRSRWNWGGAVSHIPFRTGFVSSGFDTITVDGDPALVRRIDFVEQRVFRDRASLVAEYPFSTNRRFEVASGYTRLSYDFDAETILTAGGTVIDRRDSDIEAPSALNLFETSLAYVGDYSFFGFTSPIRGSRYRFEAQPTVGTLNYMTFLGDYRKYFFTNPVTFGVRALHFGRYFGDSEDDRLNPLFLGFGFVRGYSVTSFNSAECSEDPNNPNACPEFDRLIGSRIGVFNAEVRVPLFGVPQFGLINFPTLPTELALFLDGGVAWTDADSPTIEFAERSSERIPVFSAGIAARISLFGALPLQLYYAYPFQRPQEGWQFGLFLAPGW